MKGLKVPRARFLSDTPVDPPPHLVGDDVVDIAEDGFDALLARLPPDVAAAVRLDAVYPVVHVGVGRELEAHRVAVHVDGLGLFDAGWSWFSNLVVAAAGGFGQRHPLAELEAALRPSFVVRSREDGELLVVGDATAAPLLETAALRAGAGDLPGDVILRVVRPPRELSAAAATLAGAGVTYSGRSFVVARAATDFARDVRPWVVVVELAARQDPARPCELSIATDPDAAPEEGFDPVRPGLLSLAPDPTRARALDAALRLGAPAELLALGFRRSFATGASPAELHLDVVVSSGAVAAAFESALRPALFGAVVVSLLDAPPLLQGALARELRVSSLERPHPRTLRLGLDPWR